MSNNTDITTADANTIALARWAAKVDGAKRAHEQALGLIEAIREDIANAKAKQAELEQQFIDGCNEMPLAELHRLDSKLDRVEAAIRSFRTELRHAKDNEIRTRRALVAAVESDRSEA